MAERHLHQRGTVHRPPRYKVKDSDGIRMRFFSTKQKKIIPVEVVDISSSGVAFQTTLKNLPKIGEVLKVDFNPPGSMQIACLVKVMRLEQPIRDFRSSGPEKFKVGVTFYQLPVSFHKIITDSITQVLGVETKVKRKSVYRAAVYNSWVVRHGVFVFFSALLLGLFSWGIWVVSNRVSSEEATDTNNSGWAKGFFDRNIQKDDDDE